MARLVRVTPLSAGDEAVVGRHEAGHDSRQARALARWEALED